MLFDTLRIAEELQPSFTEEQAKTLARTLSGTASDQIATRADLTELKIDLVKWIVTAIAFNFVATAGFILGMIKIFGR